MEINQALALMDLLADFELEDAPGGRAGSWGKDMVQVKEMIAWLKSIFSNLPSEGVIEAWD
jgi:hypothetical protein